MRVSRRNLLAGAVGAAACSRKPQPKDGKLHLQLSSWGEPVELLAFRRVIQRYEALHKDIAIDLETIAYEERSQIDMRLAAGVGPDLLRVQYLEVGRYSPSNALIDLSKYLPADLGEQFTLPVWTAVQYRGKPHAIPHHMDTSAILYNKTLFGKLGIRVPQTVDESWQWSEFLDVARAIKKRLEYGFAVNWVFGGAFRWLNFLHQHGGDLQNIQSATGRETLEWTQSFFRQGLVPMSDSAKSVDQLENLFATEVVGMYYDVGPQSLRLLDPHFEWAATYTPRDKNFCAELGGNAIGVTRDAKHPDVAADFALFLTNEENMRDFVIAAQFLPVRKRLILDPPIYTFRPDEMHVHLEQSSKIPVELARTVTSPEFYRTQRVLGNELDLAFTGGQSADSTLEHIARALPHAT